MVQDKFVFKHIPLMFLNSVNENNGRTLFQDAKLPWPYFKINTSKLSPNFNFRYVSFYRPADRHMFFVH